MRIVSLLPPAWLAALLLGGCAKPAVDRWQGYLEGEFVYVGSPLGGRVESLAVRRGETVAAGAALFALDRTGEAAALAAAEQRSAQAAARLADLQKGARPSELAALEARLRQARTAAELSGIELSRVIQLFQSKVVSQDAYDRVRLNHDRDEGAVAELSAQLETAQLGGRSDLLAAAAAEVAAARATVEQARWRVAQMAPVAPTRALVHDVLFRPGEVVAAGQPVIVLLPPANLKVRFFVPEPVRTSLAPGDSVQIHLSGRDEPIPAIIGYMSPQAEYTPPVLYNRDNRAKLVFMIEAAFDPGAGVELTPGEPVEVSR